MKKFALLLTVCLLLCSCDRRQEEEIEESQSVTVSETTEAPWSTTSATAEPVVTERSAVSETEPTDDRIVLTPIPSDKSFDVMGCRIYGVSMTEPKRESYDKDMLALAKEICFADEFVQREIERYNTQTATKNKIESADDIDLVSSGYSDFDMDGELEVLLLLKYTGWNGYGGGFLMYIDGDNYTILEKDINKDLKVNHIEANTYSFMMTETTQSATSYQNNIYSFENGMPEKVFDIEGMSYAYRYENGVFYCEIKYDDMVYPFVLCTDGIFRQLACEKITAEDFEAHMDGGKEYLDSIAEKGDEINEIYTYGYYSYRLYGSDYCYTLTEADGILEETKYQLSDNFPDSYTPFEFMDEIIYDADVHTVRRISYIDPDIGGGYTLYTAYEENNKCVLYIADENGDTDNMEITRESMYYLYDRNSIYNRHPYLEFYDFDVPTCFSLPRTGWGLIHDTYFIVDGKIRQGEWYLDGKKQDGVDYTMLYCYGNGGNEFVSYSLDVYDNSDLTVLDKRHFTFDRENLRFDGYSEPAPVPTGCAADADEVMRKYADFDYKLRRVDRGEYNEDFSMHRITGEGFRTPEEFIDSLKSFCTDSMAREIYSDYMSSGDFREYDGNIYIWDGPFGVYKSEDYVDSAEERNGVITARIYSYVTGQDVPYHINPPMYAKYVQEEGVWKLASFSEEK